ncbi:HPr family phosphocarrier protein [Georgenia sp. SYP-B2076]|uniref:HPr family phosphocarrier protein n=1 Tax=Georgenia sp. SYP-B2076 TaxID=2495881 RepID=UPI000F8E3A79|nr:HPr family phosphocarrier protein [Georgenia sp. SYP-B2076]
MAQRSAVVASKVGLHARPAALFVRAVLDSGVPVTLSRGGSEPVDAGSILAVMALGAQHGDEVVLAAEGAGAEQVLDDLAALVQTDLDA